MLHSHDAARLGVCASNFFKAQCSPPCCTRFAVGDRHPTMQRPALKIRITRGDPGHWISFLYETLHHVVGSTGESRTIRQTPEDRRTINIRTTDDRRYYDGAMVHPILEMFLRKPHPYRHVAIDDEPRLSLTIKIAWVYFTTSASLVTVIERHSEKKVFCFVTALKTPKIPSVINPANTPSNAGHKS